MRRRGPSSLAARLTIGYSVLFAVVGAAMLAVVYLGVRTELAGEYAGEVKEPLPSSLTGGESSADIVTRIEEDVRAAALRSVLTQSALGYTLMSMVALGLGAVMVRRTLRPLSEIATVAERISQQDLDHRAGLVGQPVEISRLAGSFDRMVDRLQNAFEGQRLFVANASHELRTPLTVIRTAAEVTQAKDPRAPRDVDAALDAIIDAATRGQDLLHGLLSLAAATSTVLEEGQPVRLDRLAGEVLAGLPAGGPVVRRDLTPAVVVGDETLLRALIGNLVGNARRHNLATNGWLEVSTASHEREVRIEVVNSGPVIDPHTADALSEPFHRLDRQVPGHGLGLSMVDAIARAHAGRLSLIPRPTGGLVARVVLPSAG